MELEKVLDQLDEIIYLSDIESYDLLYVNRHGQEYFGPLHCPVKCYEYLQGRQSPCDFCTNERLLKSKGHRYTWVRTHPAVGDMLLRDSLIPYAGRLCRMEMAINISEYMGKLLETKRDLEAARKLVDCIEELVSADNLDAAVNSVLHTLITHYSADRAYIFQFDWGNQVTSNTFEICKEGIHPKKDNLQNVPIETVAVWINIFQNEKRINMIEDVEQLKDRPGRKKEYKWLAAQRIKSLISAPIFCDGKLYGFLGVDNPASNKNRTDLLSHVTYIIANEMQKQMLNKKLIEQSYRDRLTGLPNRFAYEKMVFELENGKDRSVGVGFIDLNGVKYLNDTLGHDYGNRAIIHACKVMKDYFEPEMIYRISGDEFVVLWPDVDFRTYTDVSRQLENELHTKENGLAAFGYTWGSAAESVSKLIREAEQFMYMEKRRYYLTADSVSTQQRPEYTETLLQEFRASTFVIYLQPLYSIRLGRVYGAEALVRKIGPDGRMHSPFEFIHAMEQERMISMVDYQMLEQACNLLVKWGAFWPEFTINCNMSRITLSESNYLEHVDDILKRTGVDPTKLTFEITESSQNIQLESMALCLDEIRARGITIVVDDLGTEASCLEMLYLPQLGGAKLDRSLISKAESSKREQIIISTMIALCHDLGMYCVAEGIETKEQIELLKQMDCDRLQGFFIGKPMPPAEFLEKFGPAREEIG